MLKVAFLQFFYLLFYLHFLNIIKGSNEVNSVKTNINSELNTTPTELTNVHQKISGKRTVIIVGSGMAGISAARSLADQTNLEIVVLEANTERYGGRIWTYEVPGYPGNDPNHPVKRLALKFGIPLMKNDVGKEHNEAIGYDLQGKLYTDEDMLKADQLPRLLDELRYNFTVANSTDITFESAFNILAEKYSRLMEQHVFKYLATVGLESLYGSTKDQLSLIYSNGVSNSADGIELYGDDLVAPKGYRQILDSLVTAGRGFQLELARKVESIRYDDSGSVQLTAVDMKSKEKHTYTADYVIVAVPLGVLKMHQIEFIPPLPSPKISAIDNIGFGNMIKVILVFDEPFWPTEKFMFTESDNPTGLPAFFVNLHRVHKLPAICAFIVSQGAVMADKMPENEVIKRVMNRLGIIFGVKTVESRKLLHTKVTRWRNDPLIGGAYSFGKIGMTNEDAYNIRTPREPYLFFAGEHTSFPENIQATVHGAFMSGIRVSHEIMKQLGLSD